MMMTPEELSTGADEPYWAGCLEGQIKLPRCTGCGEWHWPAVWRCAECGGWEHEWVTVAGEGNVYSWTRTWHRFAGTEAFKTPYVSLVVSLPDAGGIRLMGVLEGEDSHVRIGDPVSADVGVINVAGRSMPVLRWRQGDKAAS